MGASVYTNTAGQGYVFHGSALRQPGLVYSTTNGLRYSAYNSAGNRIYSGTDREQVFPYGTRIVTQGSAAFYNAYDFSTISQLSGSASGLMYGSVSTNYKKYSASGILTSDVYSDPKQYPLVFSSRTVFDTGIGWYPYSTDVHIDPSRPYENTFSANTDSALTKDWYNIYSSAEILQTAELPPFYWFNSAILPLSGMKYTITVTGRFNQTGAGSTSYGYIYIVPPKGASGEFLRFSGKTAESNNFTAQASFDYSRYSAWTQSGAYPTLSYRAYGVSSIRLSADITGYIP